MTAPRVCRTREEIFAAGREAARDMADLTPTEATKVLALLAPYRQQLIKAAVGPASGRSA